MLFWSGKNHWSLESRKDDISVIQLNKSQIQHSGSCIVDFYRTCTIQLPHLRLPVGNVINILLASKSLHRVCYKKNICTGGYKFYKYVEITFNFFMFITLSLKIK
jgi:hypothetical protein